MDVLGRDDRPARRDGETDLGFWGFFVGMIWGFVVLLRGGGVREGEEAPDRTKYKSRGMMNGHKK
ncbi:hypothetical protein Syun_027905 [Stephania yunnanensis]|uniref:Uncharacterized protein n=1 Tax=Stephania yunnanensis TaxID=152371 RepID=A0AAP0EQB4_9MAGN